MRTNTTFLSPKSVKRVWSDISVMNNGGRDIAFSFKPEKVYHNLMAHHTPILYYVPPFCT